MQKIFIADEGFNREYTRSRAKGHNLIRVDSDVNSSDAVRLVTNGTTLKIEKAEDNGEDEVYVFPCKEFGLVDYNGTEAKVSVIFNDNGWMLVTLLQGAIVINLNNELLMPTIGDVRAPKVVKEDILWVNAEMLLGYGKYMSEIQQNFLYDYEFVMTLTGQLISGMSNFRIRFIHDEDVDLSLGYIAQYLQSIKVKAEAKAAKSLVNSFLDANKNRREFEFDEPDEDEDDFDDFDYFD